MREYAKVSPVFWTRGSGKSLRGDRDAQLVALYLFTCANANMIGLYYLPLSLLCHETGLDTVGASKALQRVCDCNIARYEEASELVFVPNMAAYQIGRTLKRTDKRVLGVQRELETYAKHPFAHEFYDLYREAYHLRPLTTSPSPSQGPPKPPRSQEQEQEQEQEGETRTRESPNSFSDPVSETRLSARSLNATDDGAFGGAIASWAEGIRQVTGKLFLAPSGSELTKLVHAVVQSCPDMGKRIEWARENAIAFARFSIERNATINVYRFIDFLNTPRQSHQDGPGLTIAGGMTPEQRWQQVKREEAESDARHAKRFEGAGAPPEPLAVTMARLRRSQGER